MGILQGGEWGVVRGSGDVLRATSCNLLNSFMLSMVNHCFYSAIATSCNHAINYIIYIVIVYI
jgi:hypothetical protein